MVLRVLIFPPNILLNQAETAHIAHSLRPRCLADSVRGFCPFHRRDPQERTRIWIASFVDITRSKPVEKIQVETTILPTFKT